MPLGGEHVRMYAAVEASANGVTTPTRFAETARRYGYDGIVLFQDERVPERVSAQTQMDIVCAGEIAVSDRGAIGGAIAKVRDHVRVLRGVADSPDVLRVLSDQERLDVLAWPSDIGRISHTVATNAKEHGIFIELDLSPLVRSSGQRRVAALERLVRLDTILDHFDIPCVTTTRPRSHLELRSPREIQSLGEVCGLNAGTIERGLRAWEQISQRSGRIEDDSFIEPGVRTIDDETNDR